MTARLESELRALGDLIDWPTGSDLSVAVSARLRAPSSRPRRRWLLAAAVVVLLIVILVTPPGRQAIARLA
jgi:hypothetical protein